MQKVLVSLAAAVMAVAMVACSSSSEAEPATPVGTRAAIMTADAAMQETVLSADPQGAVTAIYENLDNEPKLTEIDPDTLEEVLGVSPYDTISFIAYVSDAKGGLCDIAIIEPQEDKFDEVRESLMQYSTLRAEQFKNYDILSAYSIASGATVYNQGDYVVMLMLSDNEAAQAIVDQYIPQ